LFGGRQTFVGGFDYATKWFAKSRHGGTTKRCAVGAFPCRLPAVLSQGFEGAASIRADVQAALKRWQCHGPPLKTKADLVPVSGLLREAKKGPLLFGATPKRAHLYRRISGCRSRAMRCLPSRALLNARSELIRNGSIRVRNMTHGGRGSPPGSFLALPADTLRARDHGRGIA